MASDPREPTLENFSQADIERNSNIFKDDTYAYDRIVDAIDVFQKRDNYDGSNQYYLQNKNNLPAIILGLVRDINGLDVTVAAELFGIPQEVFEAGTWKDRIDLFMKNPVAKRAFTSTEWNSLTQMLENALQMHDPMNADFVAGGGKRRRHTTKRDRRHKKKSRTRRSRRRATRRRRKSRTNKKTRSSKRRRR